MSENPPLRLWKTLDRRLVYDHGKFLQVENHIVELPDGRIIDDWAWVKIPDAAIVMARTLTGQFLCFRQTKYAIEGITYAPVGGMLEPAEDPLAAAKRELLEETGYTAPQWIPLGSYVLDPNRGVAVMHLYLALDAIPAAEPIRDDLEDQELLLLSQEEIRQITEEGGFKDIAWAAAAALTLNYFISHPNTGAET